MRGKHKGRVQKLNEAQGLLVKAAVTNGDGDTFELALARMLQATKEVQDMNAATNGSPEHNGVVPFQWVLNHRMLRQMRQMPRGSVVQESRRRRRKQRERKLPTLVSCTALIANSCRNMQICM